MYVGPYEGVRSSVATTLKELIPPTDTYHYKHSRRFARTLEVFLDQNPSGRLLEIGTSGVLPVALHTLTPDIAVSVTNYDESLPLMHIYRAQGLAFDGYCVDLDTDQIPVPDEHFDWVVCCEVLEHMEIDPMNMMSEINRVLKPNGRLLLTTPNVASARGIAKILSGIEPHFYMQYSPDGEYHRHNYEYSIHSVVTVLKAAGFDGSAWTEDNFENSHNEIVTKLHAAGIKVSHTGDNIMTVAKKIGPVVDRYPSVIYAKD